MSQRPKPLDRATLTKEATYGRLALAAARSKQLGGEGQPSLPTITLGTPQWREWERYFNGHLGFDPVAMKRVRGGIGSGEMTVPAEWPQEFDGSYTPREAA